MAVAYLSRACEDSAEFARLLAHADSDVPTVYVEDDVTIPWYVDAVPTLVVERDGQLELYARDDAFAALGLDDGGAMGPVGPAGALGPVGPSRPEAASAQRAQRKKRPSEPLGFDGDAAFEGIYDASGEAPVVGCGANYETLIDGECDAEVTEATMREWERGLAAERGEDKKKAANSADKQLEMLMKQREQQVPAPAAVRT